MLEAEGVAFQKKPQDGSMRGLAFAKDPDGACCFVFHVGFCLVYMYIVRDFFVF